MLLHPALDRSRLHWEKEREATECWSTFASCGPEPQHPQFTSHPHTAPLLIVQRGCSPFFLSPLTGPLLLPVCTFLLSPLMVTYFSPVAGKGQGSQFPFLKWRSKPEKGTPGQTEGALLSLGSMMSSLRWLRVL